MNKIKLISLSLVIAIVLMGGAFAYWSQNVNVKANVNTGNLEVGFINCEKASGVKFWNGDQVPSVVGDYDYYGNPTTTYFAEAIISDFTNGAHQIVLNANKLFPGGAAFFEYNLKNTGTVPVEITGITITPEEMNDNLAQLKLRAHINLDGQPISTTVGTLEEIVAQLNALLPTIKTQVFPNGIQDHTLWIGLDQSETEMENVNLKFIIHFNYEQVKGIVTPELPQQ